MKQDLILKLAGVIVVLALAGMMAWQIFNPVPWDFEWQVGVQIVDRMKEGNLAWYDWALGILGLFIVALFYAGDIVVWICLSVVNLVRAMLKLPPVDLDPLDARRRARRRRVRQRSSESRLG